MSVHPTAGSAARNQFGTFQVHPASPGQVRYLKDLFESRDLHCAAPEHHDFLTEAYTQLQAGAISKKNATRALDLVIPLPARPGATGGKPASEKQVALIRRLLTEKDLTGTRFEVTEPSSWEDALAEVGVGTPRDLVAELARTSRDASSVIDELFALPRLSTGTRDWAAGVYEGADGRVYRVYLGQQSGRMLVKEVVGNREDGYTLEYIGSAARVMPADARKLTLEEAKEWGRATSHCIKCGLRLDDPESVDRGIGPVCAKKDW